MDFVLPSVLAVAHAGFLASKFPSVVLRHEPVTEESAYLAVALPALYLGGVFFGRQWMTNRREFDPSAAMLVYNAYATLLSAVMLAIFAGETICKGINPFSAPVDSGPDGSLLAYAIWVNYHSKYLEYCDTVFMLARRKFSQVSLLHVSHHVVMGPVMLLSVRLAPGGASAFGPAINSFIHTVMYAYYLVTALGYRPSWKRLLTTMQLVQFAVIMLHGLFHLARPDLGWPRTLVWVELALMVQMLFMFGDFFVGAYGGGAANKNKGGASGKAAAEGKKE